MRPKNGWRRGIKAVVMAAVLALASAHEARATSISAYCAPDQISFFCPQTIVSGSSVNWTGQNSWTQGLTLPDGSVLTSTSGLGLGNLTGPITSVGEATTIVGPVPPTAVDLSTVTSALNLKAPLASPTFTGTVTTAEINSNSSVTASAFFGDGSNLTGIASTGTPGVQTNYTLTDSANVLSLDWENRESYDSSGALAFNWGARNLYDSAGQSILEGSARTLYDELGNAVLRWESADKKLLRSGTPVLDWGALTLKNNLGLTVFNWTAPNITVSTNLVVAGYVQASTFNAVGTAYQYNGTTFFDQDGFAGDGSGISNVAAVSVSPSGVDLSTVTTALAGKLSNTGAVPSNLVNLSTVTTALNLKAPLASPTFTGSITSPLVITPAVSNTTNSELTMTGFTSPTNGINPRGFTLSGGSGNAPGAQTGGASLVNGSDVNNGGSAGSLTLRGGTAASVGTRRGGQILLNGGGTLDGGSVIINSGDGSTNGDIYLKQGLFGANALSITSGLVTIHNQYALNMTGSTSKITTQSSVTASGFFGDGSALTGIFTSSCTIIPTASFTNTAYGVAFATVTYNVQTDPVNIVLNAVGSHSSNNTPIYSTFLVDGAFSAVTGTRDIAADATAQQPGTFSVRYAFMLSGLSFGNHTFAVAFRTQAGTGGILHDAANYSQFCVRK